MTIEHGLRVPMVGKPQDTGAYAKQVEEAGFDFLERHDPFRQMSQVDWPRLREGQLDAAFWAVYVTQGDLDEGSSNQPGSGGLSSRRVFARVVAQSSNPVSDSNRPF